MTTLWANEHDGRISCEEHGGRYLQAAIVAKPTARTHRTPLGDWEKMTDADLREWEAEIGQPMTCEMCAYTARPHLTAVR
jgi:hypothetical protein